MHMRIRAAALDDAARLPPIEYSAGRRFLEIPDLACLPDVENLSVPDHRRFITSGTEWVAENEAGELVGFLAAEIISIDMHLWEFAVCEALQRRGIGREMMRVAMAYASERELRSITLTTFTDVPWNAPWYSRLGFEVDTNDARLAALVLAEVERGLPRRCAMRKRLITKTVACCS